MSQKKQDVQPACKPVERPVQDRMIRSPIERRPARTADILPQPQPANARGGRTA